MESRGRTFLQEIRDAIESADRVLAIIGPGAVVSPYVRVEWDHARLFCKGVLPILREGNASTVPSDLSTLHYVSFLKERPYEQGLRELLDKLAVEVPPLGELRTRVPSLPPHFIARPEDMTRVASVVLADVHRPVAITSAGQITTLEGMGGMGKSVLAAAFARTADTRRAFRDGVIWLTMGRTPTLSSKLRLIGTALNDDTSEYDDEEVAVARLSRQLERLVCLIILDDVWQLKHAEAVRDVLGPRCRLLITTRDTGLAVNLGAQRCPVDVLSPDDAMQLLSNWSGAELGALPPQAREVASECGRLPLALAMTGAMVGAGTQDWDAVLNRLRHADLAKIEREFPGYPYPDLLKALDVSVDALSPDLRRRYLDMAVFTEGTAVPEQVLVTFWAPDGMSASDTRLALGKMVERSLARRDAGGRILLHDLQLDFVRHQVPDLSALHARLLNAYRRTLTNDAWWTLEDDGYISEHLTSHMEQGGHASELHALLTAESDGGRCAWWMVREARAQADGFAEDLDRGWRLANAALLSKDHTFDRTSIVRLQTLYCFMASSTGNLAANVPAVVLPLLVDHHLIDTREALAQARHWPMALIALAPVLDPDSRRAVLADALAQVRTLSDETFRVEMLAKLSSWLDEPTATDVIEEAIALGMGSDKRSYPDPDDPLRAAAVKALAPRAPASLVPRLFDIAERVWRDDALRVEVVRALLPHFDGDGLARLLALARKIDNAHDKATAMTEIICRVPASRSTSHLSEALKATLYFSTVSGDDVDTLKTLAPHLRDAGLVPDALAQIIGIREESVLCSVPGGDRSRTRERRSAAGLRRRRADGLG